MAKQNYGGVYANMDFPPYTYVPYPRHIATGPRGEYEVAYSEEEERKIKARLQREHDNMPEEVEAFATDPEKEILISRARELNVPINKKWSKEKLKSVVSAAEADIDNLPPEDEDDDHIGVVSLTAPTNNNDDNAETDDKEALLGQARDLGIKAQGMHLWGVPRLKATIAEFKASQE